jgi:hypothetical protein
MITVAPQTGHILLGYESGELFVLKALTAKIGSGLRSFFAEGEHSLSMDEPITVLTCSFESVMLAASVGGTIKIWSRRDYSLLGRLDLHTRVCALAVSPWVPAAQFIAALASGEVVFGSMKGDLIKAFRFREGPISSLVCLPPPFHCLAFTAGSNVVIVDQETGSVLGRLPLPAPATTLHCARGWRLSRRGIVLTVGLEQGEVLVYQLGGGHGVFERQFGKQEST